MMLSWLHAAEEDGRCLLPNVQYMNGHNTHTLLQQSHDSSINFSMTVNHITSKDISEITQKHSIHEGIKLPYCSLGSLDVEPT